MLQPFALGAPEYGAEQLRQQKQAVYDAGYDGWVLWNPGSKYQVYLPALEKHWCQGRKRISWVFPSLGLTVRR